MKTLRLLNLHCSETDDDNTKLNKTLLLITVGFIYLAQNHW
jgi:hypothetical protein